MEKSNHLQIHTHKVNCKIYILLRGWMQDLSEDIKTANPTQQWFQISLFKPIQQSVISADIRRQLQTWQISMNKRSEIPECAHIDH